MSVAAELRRRIEDTNALIARHREALELPSASPLEAKSLKVNIRSLEKLLKRLEEELSDESIAD
jgi:hypothetical protein